MKFYLLLFLSLALILVNSSMNFLQILNDKTVITIEDAVFVRNCENFSGGMGFKLKYNSTHNITYKIKHIEINLTSVKNSSLYIVTDCDKLDSEYFSCVTFDPPEKPGDYYAEMVSDFESENYIIKKFKTVSVVGLSENYARPIETFILTKYDYANSDYGRINLNFSTKLVVRPSVYLNKYQIRCSIISDYHLECIYTNDELPFNKFSQLTPKLYHGMLINSCGKQEVELKSFVYKTKTLPKTEVNIERAEYETTCRSVKYYEDFNLKLFFNRSNIRKDPIGPLPFQLAEKSDPMCYISMTCISNGLDSYFNCTTKELPAMKRAGFYYARYLADQAYENYTVKEFNATENMTFTDRHYVQPKQKKFEFTHDYKKGTKGEIVFDFFKKVVEVPKIVINDKELQCSAEEKTIKCQFDETMFPAEGGEKTYTGNLINVCDQKESEIELKVTNK